MTEYHISRSRSVVPTVSDIITAKILPSASILDVSAFTEAATKAVKSTHEKKLMSTARLPGKHRRYYSVIDFNRHRGGTHKSPPDYSSLNTVTHTWYQPPDPYCLKKGERDQWLPYSNYWHNRHFNLSPFWTARSLRRYSYLDPAPGGLSSASSWWNYNHNNAFPDYRYGGLGYMAPRYSKPYLDPYKERPLGFPFQPWGLEAETKARHAAKMYPVAGVGDKDGRGPTWHSHRPISHPKPYLDDADYPYGYLTPNRYTFRYSR